MLETMFKGITCWWDDFKVRRFPHGSLLEEILGRDFRSLNKELPLQLESTHYKPRFQNILSDGIGS